MKVGDQIRSSRMFDGVRIGGKEPKRLEFYGEKWVVWRTWSSKGEDLGESCTSRENFDEQFELVPDFFEVGKTYERHTNWSIPAQRECTEWFKCTAVETNGDGTYVAFGRFGALGVGVIWICKSQYAWENDGWKEAR
jgi:hypothetical protein